MPEGTTALEVGVSVGPWIELAQVQGGASVTIGGVTYRVDRPNAFGDQQFLVHFTRTGVHTGRLKNMGRKP